VRREREFSPIKNAGVAGFDSRVLEMRERNERNAMKENLSIDKHMPGKKETPQAGLTKICKSMKDAIKFIQKEIEGKQQKIGMLEDELTKLQSQPVPDPKQIRKIKQEIQQLNSELEHDLPQLNAFQEEFSANCRP
jgi:chromosome segregation ATPase